MEIEFYSKENKVQSSINPKTIKAKYFKLKYRFLYSLPQRGMWWDWHNEPVFTEGCVEYIIFVTAVLIMIKLAETEPPKLLLTSRHNSV